MIRPQPRSRIAGAARRAKRMEVINDTSSTNFQVSGRDSANSPAPARALCPTLLTRMSTAPKRSSAAPNACSRVASSRQSPPMGTARRPSRARAATRVSSPPASRSTSMRSAPSLPRCRAQLLPIPLAAPVTTATLPESEVISGAFMRMQWQGEECTDKCDVHKNIVMAMRPAPAGGSCSMPSTRAFPTSGTPTTTSRATRACRRRMTGRGRSASGWRSASISGSATAACARTRSR